MTLYLWRNSTCLINPRVESKGIRRDRERQRAVTPVTLLGGRVTLHALHGRAVRSNVYVITLALSTLMTCEAGFSDEPARLRHVIYACTSFGTCAPDVLFDEASRVTCHWSLKATKRVVCSLWLIFYCRARRNAHLSAVRPSPVLKLLHTLLGNNIFICSFYCHWKDLLSCKLIPFKRVSESLCNRALCFIDLFLPILPDNIFSPISVYFFQWSFNASFFRPFHLFLCFFLSCSFSFAIPFSIYAFLYFSILGSSLAIFF